MADPSLIQEMRRAALLLRKAIVPMSEANAILGDEKIHDMIDALNKRASTLERGFGGQG